MYKCYKKINGEWQLDENAMAILGYKKQELERQLEFEWEVAYELKEELERMTFTNVKLKNGCGYSRDDFYYKDDCGQIQLESGTTYYVKDYTTEQINALDNDTLKREYSVVRCEHCQKYCQCGYCIKVGRNHYFCSSDCASHHATKCSKCGKWYMKASSFTDKVIHGLTDTADNYKLCNSCYDYLISRNLLHECADCGRLTYRPQRLCVDGTYNYYCNECAENHVTPRIIRQYHEQHNEGWTKQHATYEKTDKHTYYCGVELECEVKDGQPNDVAYQIHKIVNANKKLFEFEHDGSLTNGYETISQPCTMAWWNENATLVKSMLEKMTSLGCISHNTTTCGLHIHIGRNFFTDYEYETRFVALFYHLKNDLIKFSRRNVDNMYYCSFKSNYDKTKVFMCKKTMEGHNTALNLANEHTIEVRIFKGTLDYSSFMSCIELCYNIACYVKDREELDIENVTFEDIVNYQPTLYLKNYLQERKFFGEEVSTCALPF